MGVIRVEKTANYTVMSNYHFKEKDMSLKAKGLLSLMLSLPDEWDYSVSGLVAICKEGKDGINSTLKELEKFGYVKREQKKDKRGRFSDIDYIIYEKPNKEKPKTENPYTDNPEAEESKTENPQQLNTNKLNTKDINNLNNKDKINIENYSLETRLLISKKFITLEEAEEVEKVISKAKEENPEHNVKRIVKYILDHSIDNKHIINKVSYIETALINNINKLIKLAAVEDNNTYTQEGVQFYNWLHH